MVRRCPVCAVILLAEEWQAGTCACCLSPLTEAVLAESPPADVPAPAKPQTLTLRGGLALVAVFLFGAWLTWHLFRMVVSDSPGPQAGPEVVSERTGTEKAPPAPKEPEPEARLLLTPEVVKEPPLPVLAGENPPQPVARAQPEPLGKEQALLFAREIEAASEILCKKHFRELDEDQLTLWAIQGLFEAARERLSPEFEQRIVQTLRQKAPEEGFLRADLLVDARVLLGSRMDLVAPRDADAALRGIFRRLDPHTTLLDAEAMTRLSAAQNANKVGELGMLVRRQPGSAVVEVVTPYKDGPAYKAGIRAGDVITRVRLPDGLFGQLRENPEEIDPGTLVDEADGSTSRGPLGTRVEVTVHYPNDEKPRVYTLTRDRVKKEKLLGIKRREDDNWDHLLDPERGIYYVRIGDFQSPETARELAQLLKGFTQPKLQGLVLDLRFTGSGLIQSAFDVADLFVPSGLIVEFRSRNLQNGKGRWLSKEKAPHANLPIACLVNADAGTCTEIVASALQDHKRAQIVGERTGGKASAQNYYPTERGTLRITTSHAYRPSGKPLDWAVAGDNPDDWGVTPDPGFLVPLAAEERTTIRERFLEHVRLARADAPATKAGVVRDRQLEKALEALRRDAE